MHAGFAVATRWARDERALPLPARDVASFALSLASVVATEAVDAVAAFAIRRSLARRAGRQRARASPLEAMAAHALFRLGTDLTQPRLRFALTIGTVMRLDAIVARETTSRASPG